MEMAFFLTGGRLRGWKGLLRTVAEKEGPPGCAGCVWLKVRRPVFIL